MKKVIIYCVETDTNEAGYNMFIEWANAKKFCIDNDIEPSKIIEERCTLKDALYNWECGFLEDQTEEQPNFAEANEENEESKQETTKSNDPKPLDKMKKDELLNYVAELAGQFEELKKQVQKPKELSLEELKKQFLEKTQIESELTQQTEMLNKISNLIIPASSSNPLETDVYSIVFLKGNDVILKVTNILVIKDFITTAKSTLVSRITGLKKLLFG